MSKFTETYTLPGTKKIFAPLKIKIENRDENSLYRKWAFITKAVVFKNTNTITSTKSKVWTWRMKEKSSNISSVCLSSSAPHTVNFRIRFELLINRQNTTTVLNTPRNMAWSTITTGCTKNSITFGQVNIFGSRFWTKFWRSNEFPW